jgi:plastocyanin
MAAGFSLAPMLGASASSRGVDVSNNQFVGANDTNAIDAFVGDDISWRILDGKHTVTPFDEKQWGGNGSDDLEEATTQYTKHIGKAGQYRYFCKFHGSGTKEDPQGMWGVINVTDPSATTTTTAAPTTTTTQAPTTTTTARPSPAPTTPTTGAPAASAGTHTPTSASPAPTTTTGAKADKDKKPKDETTTTTTVPPPPPVDLPDSAIIPTLPGLDGASSVQNGAVADAPTSTPEGEAIALLKSEKTNRKGVKLLIISGLGLGALGLGTAGYKFANRSSKYFPA